jgi:DNA-binding NarL/FixJ family response regulator
MKRLLLLDDAAAVNDLFASLLRAELQIDVVPMASVGELEHVVERGARFDFALVDLSFPEERRTGMDALLAIHASSPTTVLAVITQGDSFVAQLLREVWELLPIATVVSKSAPIAFQVAQVRQLVSTGFAPIDPSVQPLLPAARSESRSLAAFDHLVVHVGHAKLWQALLDSNEDVSYQDVVLATGLRLNTVKNYRAQLLPELLNHRLDDPSLREMQAFASRCRPIFTRLIAQVRERSRARMAL